MKYEDIYEQLLEQHNSKLQRNKPYVYYWYNIETKEIYVGARWANSKYDKADYLEDGYICSQEETRLRILAEPVKWKRIILTTLEKPEHAPIFEQYILNGLDAKNQVSMLNRCNGGKDYWCAKHSEESKKKMSEKAKLRGISQQTATKISEALLGVPKSEEHKAKLRIPNTVEHCKNISKAQTGKKHTNERKQAQSQRMKGMTPVFDIQQQKCVHVHKDVYWMYKNIRYVTKSSKIYKDWKNNCINIANDTETTINSATVQSEVDLAISVFQLQNPPFNL